MLFSDINTLTKVYFDLTLCLKVKYTVLKTEILSNRNSEEYKLFLRSFGKNSIPILPASTQNFSKYFDWQTRKTSSEKSVIKRLALPIEEKYF